MSYLIGVVDDDPSILRALRRLLGAAGFVVKTFTSGEELLASDALGTIDCLVLDIHLGGCSGFEIQERLARPQPSIPIVFITAHDDTGARERVHQTTKSPFLRKPFDAQALIQAITTALTDA